LKLVRRYTNSVSKTN